MHRAILLYVEAIGDARKFMSAARAAARAKPVVVIKSGRHAQGARAAATHTGALAGSIFKFTKHGKADVTFSELLPHTAKMADDLCVVRSVTTEAINHDPAVTFFQTGSMQTSEADVDLAFKVIRDLARSVSQQHTMAPAPR